MRLRLDISYDGTDFSGWARQPNRRTVQGVLEDALAKQPPGSSAPTAIVVAGRTDAGVHAACQVAHVDVAPLAGKTSTRVAVDPNGIPDLNRMRHRWNRYLPSDVRVLDARVAPGDFDARFSAVRRRYRYRVCDASWGVDPLRRKDTLAWPRPLSTERMNEAAYPLLGLHDFAAFCKQREGATTVRTLQRCVWTRTDDLHTASLSVQADAFCHSMVRSLVGAMLLVGDGRRDIDWPASLLASRVRGSAVAPAHGLTLVGVDYPRVEELATRAQHARNRRVSLSPTTSVRD